jgi:DNA-directed RNA polymerase specialized sigma24 family protein
MKDANELRHEVLKSLAMEWQAETDTTKKDMVFKKILVRVDKLLVHIANKLKGYRRELQDVDDQELYQTAILGLYRGIASVKPNDPGRRVVARIISYVKEEIRKNFLVQRGPKNRISLDEMTFEVEAKTQTSVTSAMEVEEISSAIQKLVDTYVLPQGDVDMFLKHTIEGVPFNALAKGAGIHETTAARRVHSVRNEIRKFLGETDE